MWLSCRSFLRIYLFTEQSYEVLEIERMNDEDLGNWGLDDVGGAKMHFHFFGRAKKQIHQVSGQHLFAYFKGHEIYNSHLKPFNKEDLQQLKSKIKEILNESKYVKMAELAGLE